MFDEDCQNVESNPLSDKMIEVEEQQHKQIVPEARAEFLQSLGDVVFNGFLGNSKLNSYFPVGHALEAAETENCLGAFPELLQRVFDDFADVGLLVLR